MMRIYLASRYSRFEEMQGYRDDLEDRGHIVTSRWIDGSHKIALDGLSEQAGDIKRAQFAREDYNDIVSADCVISFTEEPRSTNSRGGRHVEFGIAVASGKRVIVVGHRENVFHHLVGVEFFENWEDALKLF